MRVTIAPSSRAGYKYVASDGSRTTHFGAKGYEDYTMHRDEKRRTNYLARHASREATTRPWDPEDPRGRWQGPNRPHH